MQNSALSFEGVIFYKALKTCSRAIVVFYTNLCIIAPMILKFVKTNLRTSIMRKASNIFKRSVLVNNVNKGYHQYVRGTDAPNHIHIIFERRRNNE
jgi:hypothetical protein